ncbi:MAG: molecular chaperone HtpG [Clostridiales Family XIII bacterium]|jgi:molecular chaperone HtpG|nr:molecular chaperone HtpG [Clostridiales Family XIII bacterium]
MAKKQFKAESKRLLDLMINSIYTHKEIFLRELISNASDAIDKLYYKSLTEKISGISRDDFYIRLEADKDARTLVISDNGIGMTREEMEANLGTIAKSGSLVFKKDEASEEAAAKEIDIIGQFGVGFYSAFMVSSDIKVLSKAFGEDIAYEWESKGADGYTMKEAEKDSVGTEITLTIKENASEENYDDYLSEWTLKRLIKRYSDYIRYPIKMQVEKSRRIEDEADPATGAQDDGYNGAQDDGAEGKEPKFEKYIEDETLNSMVPIWKRAKKDITDEEYADFYKDKFADFEDPLKVIHSNVEGVVSYDALLFIPARAPFNYYTKDYEKGLQLYSSGVMIMEKADSLLPDYFGFVKGLVDSQDLSLNISREMLQHDRQLKAIEQRIEKKIKSELENMLSNDREGYEKFWAAFGLQLKFGLYDNYGQAKDAIKDIVLFYSSSEKKLVTFREYVSRMPEDQKYIYFATGESIDKIDKMPQTELLKDKGYEILYGTDQVDEFALKMMISFDEKEFRSVSDSDLGIEESEEEKKKAEEQAESYKDLLEAIKAGLEGKVNDVKLSKRLKSHPVVLVAGDGMSLEMEKILNQIPSGEEQKVKAERILEINADHAVLKALEKIYENDKDSVKEYAGLLYDQALLMEGLPVEDPVAFSNSICSLIEKAV